MPRPSADGSEQAIDWAIENKVDIINISAGFEEYHKDIDMAIKKATLAVPEILIFAAAGNWGNTMPVAFPARLTDNVFCIFSYSGKLRVIKDTNPNPVGDGPNFALLGQDVAPNPASNKKESGTSIACAIATGLAGRILDFVRQDDVKRGLRLSEENREKVGTKNGMTRIFRQMSNQDPPYLCVAPWQMLPGGSFIRNRQGTRAEIYGTIERCFWNA